MRLLSSSLLADRTTTTPPPRFPPVALATPEDGVPHVGAGWCWSRTTPRPIAAPALPAFATVPPPVTTGRLGTVGLCVTATVQVTVPVASSIYPVLDRL